MNEIQIFNNPEFGTVRTVEIDGEPYFVARDIAEILGYANPPKAVRDHVDEEDKGVNEMVTPGGKQSFVVINESGLYSLILSSKLPSAKKFKRWVTSEVLPEIRKTGAYVPKDFAAALRAYADEVEKNERLALENKDLKPKAEFFDAVTDSKDAIQMADVAKILDMGIGRNKLFEFLRDQKILMDDNRPYQKYVDAGYFRTIEQKFDKGCGEIGINIKTLVFQKGVEYIRRKLQEAM